MGYRRQPTDEPDDVDVEAIAPHWCARWVWVLRWGDELMGGAECFAHNHRTVYNAGPAEPCLERVRRWWAEKTPEQRRSVWADDEDWIGWDGVQHCTRHDRAIAYCDPSCPAVGRLQRQHDESHAHAWTKPHPAPPDEGDNMTTNRTNEPTSTELDATLRAANGRGRVDFDAPPPAPADVPAEDTVVQPVDLADDELDALLLDRSTRRETLADPGVKIRLARRDPTIAAEIDAWNARALAAEERAEAAVAAAAGPRPQPLPGGGAAPVPPSPPSPESVLRAAASAARGEPIDHRMRPYVQPGTDVTVTTFAPR